MADFVISEVVSVSFFGTIGERISKLAVDASATFRLHYTKLRFHTSLSAHPCVLNTLFF
jgi:hypothetical protein